MSPREDTVVPMQEIIKAKLCNEKTEMPVQGEGRTDAQQEEERPQRGLGSPSVLEVRPRPDDVVQCLPRGQSVGHITVTH